MTKSYQQKLIEMAEKILPQAQELLRKNYNGDTASEVCRLLGYIQASKEDGERK